MDCSMQGFPVHHQLPELAQTHDHLVSDAIQPSHPLSSPSPPAFSLSQRQSLFKWVSSLCHVAKVFQLQHQSFQWICRSDFLYDWLVWSPCSPRTLRSLLQHQSSKPSILQHLAFLTIQLSHPYISSVQFSSVAQSCPHFATSWAAVHQSCLSITNSRSLCKLMSIKLVMPSNHLILWCPHLLPSIFPNIRVFSNESALHIRWLEYWSFSFGISPSNEYSGLIYFSMAWLDLLAVQDTFKSLLQHHSSKASIFQCSTFFVVQLSHPYMTTGKTIALIRQTFVSKVMSLLSNMLFRLPIAFLPRS